MDKKEKEKLTENVKVRVSGDEKTYITEAAKSSGISVSDLIRKSIFETNANRSSSYATKIQQNRIRHEFRNRVVSMKISKETKNKLLKELSDID